jgi:hypothetical protein
MKSITIRKIRGLFQNSTVLITLLAMLLVLVGLQDSLQGTTTGNLTNQTKAPNSQVQEGKSSITEAAANALIQPILLAPIKVSGEMVFIVWPDGGKKSTPSPEVNTTRTAISNVSTANWEIFFIRSPDAGKTFDSPINLSNSPNGTSAGPEIAINERNANDHSIFVTFWDNKTGGTAPYLVSSVDNGITFTTPVRLNITERG